MYSMYVWGGWGDGEDGGKGRMGDGKDSEDGGMGIGE